MNNMIILPIQNVVVLNLRYREQATVNKKAKSKRAIDQLNEIYFTMEIPNRQTFTL